VHGRRDLVLEVRRNGEEGDEAERSLDVPATLVENPCAIVLALARIVASGAGGQLPLGDGWRLEVAREEKA
jgi:hypothetical protein